MGGEPLNRHVMAEIYGYRFNDECDLTIRVIPILCQNPCSVGRNSCTIPRVEAEDGAHYPSDNAELASH